MKKINCYAVFEGGGIKGVAFAGALQKAEEAGLNFIGYAGASAGAIIAFLAALGYSGYDIFKIINKVDFKSLLNEPTPDELKNLNSILKKAKEIGWFNEKWWGCKKILHAIKLKNHLEKSHNGLLPNAIKRLITNNGLYNKDNLIDILANFAREKITRTQLPKLYSPNGAYLSFKDFNEITNIDLKIISTDTLTGRAIEFSVDSSPDACVLTTISASASYPLIFEPTSYQHYVLADGGLSCNLPTYLFHKDNYRKLPIFSFDLITTNRIENKHPQIPSFESFTSHLKNLVNSSLDASTNIISEVVGGVSVPLTIPQSSGTLNFAISKVGLYELYSLGRYEANKFFNTDIITGILRETRTEHDIAKLLFGKMDSILTFLINFLPKSDKIIKAWIYTNIDVREQQVVSFAKDSNINLSFDTYNIFSDDQKNSIYKIPFKSKYLAPADHIFPLINQNGQLNQDNDCTAAWLEKKPTLSYNDEKVRICYPVLDLDLRAEVVNTIEKQNVMAVICISMETGYNNCPWLNISQGNIDITDFMFETLSRTSIIVRNMIYGHQANFYDLRRTSDYDQ